MLRGRVNGYILYCHLSLLFFSFAVFSTFFFLTFLLVFCFSSFYIPGTMVYFFHVCFVFCLVFILFVSSFALYVKKKILFLSPRFRVKVPRLPEDARGSCGGDQGPNTGRTLRRRRPQADAAAARGRVVQAPEVGS